MARRKAPSADESSIVLLNTTEIVSVAPARPCKHELGCSNPIATRTGKLCEKHGRKTKSSNTPEQIQADKLVPNDDSLSEDKDPIGVPFKGDPIANTEEETAVEVNNEPIIEHEPKLEEAQVAAGVQVLDDKPHEQANELSKPKRKRYPPRKARKATTSRRAEDDLTEVITDGVDAVEDVADQATDMSIPPASSDVQQANPDKATNRKRPIRRSTHTRKPISYADAEEVSQALEGLTIGSEDGSPQPNKQTRPANKNGSSSPKQRSRRGANSTNAGTRKQAARKSATEMPDIAEEEQPAAPSRLTLLDIYNHAEDFAKLADQVQGLAQRWKDLSDANLKLAKAAGLLAKGAAMIARGAAEAVKVTKDVVKNAEQAEKVD